MYREFDEKIGFSQLIKDKFWVNDGIEHREHQDSDFVLEKIYKSISGYHTDDSSENLAIDPMFTEVLGKDKLASQPTVSRLNTKLDKDNLKQFEGINFELLSRIYDMEAPEHIVLDIDSTNFQTFGKQYGSNYNFHYGANGYHPLFAFDGLIGDLIKAELRAGNVYTSRQVVRFIAPILKWYKKNYPWINIVIRGDSGFANPKLFDMAEKKNASYVIRLKANSNLYKLASNITCKLDAKTRDNVMDYQVVYGEFKYKDSSWDKERRVIVKIEKPEGQMAYNYIFIVTDMTLSPENVVRFYCNRGTMENFIKEAKSGFGMSRMSHSKFMANANKMWQIVLAYNLNNWLRRLCFSKHTKSNRIETIRTKFIKIAGRLVRSARYKIFKLCSSCPYQNLFWKILWKINRLPSRT